MTNLYDLSRSLRASSASVPDLGAVGAPSWSPAGVPARPSPGEQRRVRAIPQRAGRTELPRGRVVVDRLLGGRVAAGWFVALGAADVLWAFFGSSVSGGAEGLPLQLLVLLTVIPFLPGAPVAGWLLREVKRAAPDVGLGWRALWLPLAILAGHLPLAVVGLLFGVPVLGPVLVYLPLVQDTAFVAPVLALLWAGWCAVTVGWPRRR